LGVILAVTLYIARKRRLVLRFLLRRNRQSRIFLGNSQDVRVLLPLDECAKDVGPRQQAIG
jgi:hypothetical protein